jgi:hypothetical protein
MIPLSGQGKPLPLDCPYRGEWLLEDVMFLYHPDGQQTVGGGFPDMTAGFQRSDGGWCFGFNAMQLAWWLGIGSEEIFEANRNGTLILETVEEVVPMRGATRAKTYTFGVGDKVVGMTIEVGGPERTA